MWLNWLSVFVYRMVLTLSFLGVKPTRKNIAAAAALSAVCLLAQWTLASIWGFEVVNKAYPFIVHLPLFLLCVFFYKKSPASAL